MPAKLAEEEFWARTERQSNGCLLWTGPMSGNYGLWGRRQYAHHEAWERYRGLPANVDYHTVIAHSCDTPLCVEGTHLERKSQRENLLDRKIHGAFSRR